MHQPFIMVLEYRGCKVEVFLRGQDSPDFERFSCFLILRQKAITRTTYLEERAHTFDSIKLSNATAAEFHVFLCILSLLNIPPGEDTSNPLASVVSRLLKKK